MHMLPQERKNRNIGYYFLLINLILSVLILKLFLINVLQGVSNIIGCQNIIVSVTQLVNAFIMFVF